MKNLAKKVIKAYPNSNSKIIFENKTDPQEGFSISISTSKAEKELNFIPQNDLSQGIRKIAEADDSIHFFKQ